MIITITPSLFTFIEKVKSYHVGLTKTTRDIKDALTSLEAIINRVDESPEILITIKDMHRQELLKTKHILLTLIKQDSKLFRSIHDRFVNIIQLHEKSLGITFMFEKFIKGITYFVNETDPDTPYPVYHRFASCGKIGTQASLSCLKGMPRMARNIARSRVEKCYIERLIYDKMYSHETLHFPERGNVNDDISLQNKEHIYYLDVIRKEYQQCFKGYEMNISITWSKDTIPSIPEALTITSLKNGQVVSSETYKKTIQIGTFGEKSYEELVQCTREAAEKRFKKYQSFLGGEQRWKVVINK